MDMEIYHFWLHFLRYWAKTNDLQRGERWLWCLCNHYLTRNQSVWSPQNIPWHRHTPPLSDLSRLSFIRLFVLVSRMICTEWLTSSWWTSSRTSGAPPHPPCQGHRGPTAVSPPDELTASPTGTGDFSLFSKRTEPCWTSPEQHSRQTRDRQGEGEGGNDITVQG